MPVPEDFYEATFIWKVNTSPKEMTCSLGLLDVSIGGPRSAGDMADDVYTVATTSSNIGAADSMIDEYSFLGVVVAFGTPTGDIIGQHLATVVGTVSDSPITSNCALLVNKNTALGGRKFRGRFFGPPCLLQETAVDGSGNILGAVIPTLQARWDGLYDDLIAADIVPHLFHQGLAPPVPTPITSLTVQSQIATQRRRMRS